MIRVLALLFVTGCLGGAPTEIESATLHHTGGLAPSGGAGSTCQPMDDTWQYVSATRVVKFQHCESTAMDAPFMFTTGQVTLSAGDAATLERALMAVEPGGVNCGGDVQDRLDIIGPTHFGSFTQCASGEQNVYELFLDVGR